MREKPLRAALGLGLASGEAAEQPVFNGEESELSLPTSSHPLRGREGGDGETARSVCRHHTKGWEVCHDSVGLISHQSRLQMGQARPSGTGQGGEGKQAERVSHLIRAGIPPTLGLWTFPLGSGWGEGRACLCPGECSPTGKAGDEGILANGCFQCSKRKESLPI